MSFSILFILPVHPPPITHTPPPGHPPRLTPRGLRAPHTPRGFRPAPQSHSARRSAQAATRPCLDQIYCSGRGISMRFHEIWIPTYINLILTNELLNLHLECIFCLLQIHLRSDSAVHRPRRPIASWSTLIVEQGVLQLRGPPLLLICSHCKPYVFGDYTIHLCESI